jgi:hypothetical protein
MERCYCDGTKLTIPRRLPAKLNLHFLTNRVFLHLPEEIIQVVLSILAEWSQGLS